MQLAGKLVFLTTNVFDKMARGGLQPFYTWLAGNISPEGRLDRSFQISASLAVGLEFFIRGLRLLQPRLYKLSQPLQRAVLIYSDAEWTVLDEPPWFSKGLGGILWADDTVAACAVECPDELVSGLSKRKTQIIPLELMAAAGMLHTYRHLIAGKDILFFIDNQSVCCALTKGCSRSWDIQMMSSAWHLFCLTYHCRIWIEWVPSGDNPADILSREKKSLYPTTSGEVDEMLLPSWVDLRGSRNITRILDEVEAGRSASYGAA